MASSVFNYRANIYKLRSQLRFRNSAYPCRTVASAAATGQSLNNDVNSDEEAFFSEEPRQPMIQAEAPGPRAREAIARLDRIYDTRSLNMMANYNASLGN